MQHLLTRSCGYGGEGNLGKMARTWKEAAHKHGARHGAASAEGLHQSSESSLKGRGEAMERDQDERGGHGKEMRGTAGSERVGTKADSAIRARTEAGTRPRGTNPPVRAHPAAPLGERAGQQVAAEPGAAGGTAPHSGTLSHGGAAPHGGALRGERGAAG